MNYLGIDYGDAKIGLAISSGKLADPLTVIYYQTIDEVIKKILKVIEEEHIDIIAIGLPEGQVAVRVGIFKQALEEKTNKQIIFTDETLSTKEAQSKAIEAGINRKKRRHLEDAYSAALILQQYLDTL